MPCSASISSSKKQPIPVARSPARGLEIERLAKNAALTELTAITPWLLHASPNFRIFPIAKQKSAPISWWQQSNFAVARKSKAAEDRETGERNLLSDERCDGAALIQLAQDRVH
jgi:hypothetical protein